jgi:histidine kinase
MMRGMFRQLRWRIVAAQMVVVVVGVALVLLMAYLVTAYFVPADVVESLTVLLQADDLTIEQAADGVLAVFRNSVLTAVSVAALGAILTGLLSSFLLAREILRPLRQIAESSHRIARGHYSERVAVPPSGELALVADNFNQMAESLERVEEQRVALIGNVSHELRTPLTGLNGYLEGLLDGVFPANEETFAQMAQEVRRLRRLVDDLQALSRVEAGRISLTPAAFDIVALAEHVLTRLRPQIEAQNLTVEREYAYRGISVYADEDRTAQILTNLLGNAIAYTGEGGQIAVRVQTERGMVRVAIEDNGMGIPPEALPYIFERFYRVDASRTRGSGGSGIGLTISRYLAWAMGGELTAVSEGVGKGSTFTFTLPLART